MHVIIYYVKVIKIAAVHFNVDPTSSTFWYQHVHMSHGLFSKLRAEIWLKYLIVHQGMDLEHSPKLGTAQAIRMPNTNLWLIPAFVCALLFYTSFTLWAGTAWAARVRPSLGFINHDATLNGRIILLLVVDWEVSPVTVCIREPQRERERIRTLPCDCTRAGVSNFCFSLSRVCVRAPVSSQWVDRWICATDLQSMSHTAGTHTHATHTVGLL